MTQRLIALNVLAAVSAVGSAPAVAVPGGQIATLQHGTYVCELPGDATGPAGLRRPDRDFTVINTSSYLVDGQRGTYLLTGDLVTFTSGPRRGEKLTRLSANFLRELRPDGTPGPLRCVRRVINNR